jgi:hypothetical protein
MALACAATFLLAACGGGGGGSTDTSQTDQASAAALATSSDAAVTVQWDPPSTLASGDAIGTLSGYRIYYGTAPGTYTGSVFVAGAGSATRTVTGLTRGTSWYFTVTAVDVSGNESSIGYESSKTL